MILAASGSLKVWFNVFRNAISCLRKPPFGVCNAIRLSLALILHPDSLLMFGWSNSVKICFSYCNFCFT